MTHFTYQKKGGEGDDFFLPGVGSSTNGKITFDRELETTALELVTDEGEQDKQTEEQTDNQEN